MLSKKINIYYLKKIIIKVKNKFSLLYMPTILQPFYQKKKKKKQFFNPNSNPDSKPKPKPNPNPHSQLFVYSLIISYWI